MRYGIAAVVLATGCLSTPPYQPQTSVSYAEAGAGGTATGHDFALRFAAGDGFHFPDALMIDGADVMGHDTGQRCFDEEETGFVIQPTPRISAHGAPPLLNQLVPVLRGPAVVQVQLTWTTRLTCAGDHTPGGTSLFTVFPDGRIVRHDTLDEPNAAELFTNGCACDSWTGGFTVATYWTLAWTPTLRLYPPDLGMVPSSADPGMEIANRDTACFDHGAYQTAFAWHDPNGTTIHGGHEVNKLLVIGRHFTVGDSMPRFGWQDSSALFIGRTGCTDALARAGEHVAPSPLTISEPGNATRTVMPGILDGIYGSSDSGDSPPGLALTGDRVELTGPVNSSFAVWLRFPRPVAELRATRDGTTGAWYLPQRVDDRGWIVWFRDRLYPGQTIAIEPF